jgi:type 1 glutamine amidotransferase
MISPISSIALFSLICTCMPGWKEDPSGMKASFKHKTEINNTNPEALGGGARIKKKVVFFAGKCSHGPGEHEYKAGCFLLSKALQKAMPNDVETVVYYKDWPVDEKAFDNVSAIVMFGDGGIYNVALQHLDQINALMKKGVGLACLHYSVEIPQGKPGDYLKEWIGGYFEQNWSINPFWTAEFKSLPKHPVTRGVRPFSLRDEWYYHMRFQEDMKNVTPILTAIPPDSTLSRKDGPWSNNKYVRAEIGLPQHVCWVVERPDGGRGFGFTGGHFHKNWANDDYRKLVLNGIAWIAKIKIPGNGIETPTPTESELKNDLEDKPCPK